MNSIDGKRGWCRADLGRIIQFQPSALIHTRFMMGHGGLKQSVQAARRKTFMKLAIDLAYFREYTLNAIPGLGGNPEYRRKGNEIRCQPAPLPAASLAASCHP